MALMEEERLIFREEVTDRTRSDYLTHAFFPYPARFIPQIPRYFIREYMHNHHAILDPFCGCGTTLVEAKLLGYNSYGIEMNPFGRLLTEVKTTPLNLMILQKERKRLLDNMEKSNIKPTIPNFPNRDFWFQENIQEQLGMMRSAIDLTENEACKKFFLVCLASIIRKCSNADPAISKPVYTETMKKIVPNRKIDPFKMFLNKMDNYSNRLITLSNFLEHDNTQAQLIGEDARKIDLTDEAVHLIITSPAFVNAQEYFRTTKFEIWWTGIADVAKIHELEKRLIGLERVSKKEAEKLKLLKKDRLEKIDEAIEKVYAKDKIRAYIMYQYFTEMITVFAECKRVLDKDGRFTITIGDNTIRKIPIKTHELIIDLAEYVGFKTEKVGYDIIKVHSLSIKRNKTAGLIDREWAMVFAKN